MKEKVLNWSSRFSTFCFLDNHQYTNFPHTIECLLAAGVKRKLVCKAGHALQELTAFAKHHKGWLFGHLGYELKDEIEALHSGHKDRTGFPDLCFFEPETVVHLSGHSITIEGVNPDIIYEEICMADAPARIPHHIPLIKGRLNRDEYIDIIQQLRKHILRGDCYEINFCQEFYAEQATLDPLHTYRELSRISPNPFSALYRLNDSWLLCASPERFLQKKGNRVLSQPIKGTARRYMDDPVKDEATKQSLAASAKDRSENVMVVDLVRNDLARICKEGTVKVDELYGIYSFPQVHQMISTISGELADHITPEAIIRATFPMGSMTGAPKKRVMELIEAYEQNRRGIFSGALGYIDPNGDMDFNVVIRSILYNAASHYVSFLAGSGITYYSVPEQEWEECLMKAAAMKKVLNNPA
jgi:para-aminobenzoate synthetase component I